jgi:cobalt-zinc-cadmium efflux system membrane fusion protein
MEMPMNSKLLIMLIALPLALSACGGSEPVAAPTAPTKAEAGHGAGDKKEGHEEGGHVELTPEQINTAGIRLVQAGPATIRETLPLYGVVAPNAERVLEVGARFPGVIRNVAKKVGDPVRQGETLATVESNESLQTYVVVAPITGVVTGRKANSGEQTGDKILFTVADLSTVWVELSLFPRDVAKVRVGQSVRVRGTEAKLSADGKVVYVAPFGSSANQTLTARVLLDNGKRRWTPGLYVTAQVTLAVTSVPLAVRNEAVQTVEERSVVFAQGKKGFESRPVRLGRSDDEISEVLEGLKSGETYATSNSFILKAELGKGSAGHED